MSWSHNVMPIHLPTHLLNCFPMPKKKQSLMQSHFQMGHAHIKFERLLWVCGFYAADLSTVPALEKSLFCRISFLCVHPYNLPTVTVRVSPIPQHPPRPRLWCKCALLMSEIFPLLIILWSDLIFDQLSLKLTTFVICLFLLFFQTWCLRQKKMMQNK